MLGSACVPGLGQFDQVSGYIKTCQSGLWAVPPTATAVNWGGIGGTLSAQTDLNTALAARLVAASNLSDVGSALTARTNLGLTGMATASPAAAGDLSGTWPVITVAKVNGNIPGGTCTGQFVRSINSSAVPTCQGIAAGDLPATVLTTAGGQSIAGTETFQNMVVNGTCTGPGCTGGAIWGSITGTLSSQTDLNTALTARLVIANNLSELTATAATARTNLGLGSISTLSSTASGDLSGTWPNITVARLNGTIAGGTCTAQFVRSISSSAVPTCQSIATADLPASVVTTAGGQSIAGTTTVVNMTVTGTCTGCAGAGSVAWGSITGTLSSQTDLNTALNARLITANNLSELTATAATARTNLGLGTIATLSSTAGGDLSGTWPNVTIGAGKVTLGDIASIANNTFMGNVSGSAAAPSALSVAQMTTALGVTTSTPSRLVSLDAGGLLAANMFPASGVSGTTCTLCSLTYGADGRITVASNGTGGTGFPITSSGATLTMTNCSVGPTCNIDVASGVSTPAYAVAGTTTCNFAAPNYTCKPGNAGVMNGNTTLAVSNMVAGIDYVLIWVQDGTGGRTVTNPGNFSGVCAPGAWTEPNVTMTIHLTWIGTTAYEASCLTNQNSTFVVGPERPAITTSIAGQGLLTFDSASHTVTYFANASVTRHAIPRVSAGDQIACSDTTGTGCFIANSATALTGAVAANTCETPITATATGAQTTDSVFVSPNTNPTAVMGYGPGQLYVWWFVSLNTMNFIRCNPTAASITPGSLTMNWRILR